MLFNSLSYFAFFGVTLALFWAARGHGTRMRILLGASWVFYAAWYPVYLLLFLTSIAVNHALGPVVQRQRDALREAGKEGTPRVLPWAVALNLTLLGIFKYLDFTCISVNDLLDLLGTGGPRLSPPGLFLPLGISFYTFQMIAYLVDISRGQLQAIRSFSETALFISFFPQLIAGPIVRGREILSQLESERRFDPAQALHGLDLIFVGLFKKVVLADSFSPFADAIFGAPAGMGTLPALLGVYAYAVQIYCDFSGYTDIGRGCAYLLGFELPVNFQWPYLSVNITEFWRRWHITLSSWLRDYLYIPLGGNRGGSLATYRNMLVTMTLGGLWHGAAWTFVIWGVLHGLALGLTRLSHEVTQRPPTQPLFEGRLYRVFSVLATFHLVCLGWIFFRATSFQGALQVLREIFGLSLLPSQAMSQFGLFRIGSVALGVLVVAILHTLQYWYVDRVDHQGRAWNLLRPLYYASVVVAISLFSSGGPAGFIYFQF